MIKRLIETFRTMKLKNMSFSKSWRLVRHYKRQATNSKYQDLHIFMGWPRRDNNNPF